MGDFLLIYLSDFQWGKKCCYLKEEVYCIPFSKGKVTDPKSQYIH